MTEVAIEASAHEQFANAPLQLVAVEVTYPPTSAQNTDVFAAITEVLGDGAVSVLGGALRVTSVAADGTGTGESMLFRMTNRQQTVSLSAWPTSLVVECSNYGRYEQFREVVRALVDAYTGFVVPEALTRFGIRYIDEMHVPGAITSVDAWAPYVNPLLLAPARLLPDRVTNLSTGFTVDLGQHRAINVRCATAPGRAVTSEPLQLRERPDTPAFVLDIDAVYQPTEPLREAVTGNLVARIADELRPGVRAVFDAVFTDEALETFRRTGETT